MWVYEEMIDGRKLTEIINTEHENVKYLPGHKLPKNVVRSTFVLGKRSSVNRLTSVRDFDNVLKQSAIDKRVNLDLNSSSLRALNTLRTVITWHSAMCLHR